MKKIMFNDRYGLTKAVLQGRKTVTRRIMNPQPNKCDNCTPINTAHCMEMSCSRFPITVNLKPPYKVGEIVAVAQSYSSYVKSSDWDAVDKLAHSKGWFNKMFVKAELMPRKIRILDVRAEQLQNITDEDCSREGLLHVWDIDKYYFERKERDEGFYFDTLREAYASLIDKICGKGTWERNPFVWRIEFELVK